MKKKRIVMKDIAVELGVSVNSVSLALNGKAGLSDATRREILSKAEELGYAHQGAAPAAMQNVALLLNHRYMNNFSFYTQIILAVTSCAGENGCNVIMDFFHPHQPELPAALANGTADGVIIAGTHSDRFARLLLEAGPPVVSIDHMSWNIDTDSILIQNAVGGYRATQHLIDKGHREIGFIGDIQYSISLRQRYEGFRDCVAGNLSAGVNPDSGRYSITGDIAGSIIEKSPAVLLTEIRKLPALPTAWVCCNDETALVLYQALAVLGIQVGRDVSVIGFDDADTCTILEPKLTTMHVYKTRMGREAFFRLRSRIETPGLPIRHISFPVTLVERDSVVPL